MHFRSRAFSRLAFLHHITLLGHKSFVLKDKHTFYGNTERYGIARSNQMFSVKLLSLYLEKSIYTKRSRNKKQQTKGHHPLEYHSILTHLHHDPTFRVPFADISDVQLTTGSYHRARSVVGAVNDI